jgi:methylated-DNA-[protein]-cysteine S-methyltransferase
LCRKELPLVALATQEKIGLFHRGFPFSSGLKNKNNWCKRVVLFIFHPFKILSELCNNFTSSVRLRSGVYLAVNLFKIMETVYIKTPLGIATIIGDENGIAVISVSDEGIISNEIPTVLQEAVTQLNDYFEGKRTDFDFKLNPKGTAFQQKVWNALLEIPFGKTRTYLEQSKILGDVKAIRAVASANGKNPLWIVVPCHRVIGTNGSLTGYAGGLWRKKWLLEHENPSTQQRLF